MPQLQNPPITSQPTRRVFIRQGKCRTGEARGGWMARRLGMRPTLPRTTASWWWLRSKPSFIDLSSPVWDWRRIRCSRIFSNGIKKSGRNKRPRWPTDLLQRAERIGPKSSVIWMLASRQCSLMRRALSRPTSQSGVPINLSETKCSPLPLHASHKRLAVQRDLSPLTTWLLI